jgi:MFS family permease
MTPFSQQTRGIVAVLLNNVLLGFAVGMFLPFVPLRLHELGVGAGLIGLNAAAASVAVLGIASITTRILRCIGYPVAIGLGGSLFALTLLGMMWQEGFGAWTACRFVAGLGLALHWISSESWINQTATDARRGRILSLYVACFIGGTAAGSASLDFLDLSGHRPFFIMIALTVVATALIPLGHKGAPPTSGIPTAGLLIRIRQAPRLMASAMMMGIAQGSALVLMAFYGVSAGLTQGAAVCWWAGCCCRRRSVGR